MTPRAALLGVVSAGFVLRVFELGRQSMWIDEAGDLNFARYPLGDLLTEMVRHHEVHPPLYTVLLHFWSNFGQSEAWVRLPSAVAGAITVALTYWLAREVGADRKTGVLAAALLAFSSYGIFLSREVKDYPLALVFGVAATAYMARMLRKPGALIATGYALSCVLGFYTNYFMALLCPAHLLAALMARIRDRDRALPRSFWKFGAMSCGLIFLGVAPWTSFLKSQAGFQDQSLFHRPELKDVALIVLSLLYGTTWRLPGGVFHTTSAVVLLLIPLTLATAGARALGRGPGWLLGFCSSLPTLILFIVATTTSHHLFWHRYLSFSLPPVLVLMACGIRTLRPRSLGWGFGAAVVAMNCATLFNLYFHPGYASQNWRGIAAYIHEHARADDLIVAVPSMMILPIRYYYHGPAHLIGLDGVDEATLREHLRGARHVWLAEPPFHPIVARREVDRWLDEHAFKRVGGVTTESLEADNVLVLLEFAPSR